MSQTKFSAVLRHIRGMAIPDATKLQTDGGLLTQFVTSRDEEAFTAIVQRHGRLVWSVCHNVLHHDQDAEDAMQAAFLVLATKARSVKKRSSLASWLHGVAYRTAMLAKRRAAAQRSHEKARTILARSHCESEVAWRELLAILDAEIRRLPEKLAAPFVLCCLEGLSGPEAARHLGWKEGTVTGRLTQARKLLRQRLLRRGINLALVLGGLSVASCAAPAAGFSQLAADVLRGVRLTRSTLAATTVVSSRALDLAQEVVKAMFTSKAMVGLLVLGMAAASVGLVWYGISAAGSTGTEQPSRTELAVEVQDPPKLQDAKSAAQTMSVRVFDLEGKPLSGANVHASIWTDEKDFKSNRDYQTDHAGYVQVDLPKTLYILRLWVNKKPFVSMYAGWEKNELSTRKQPPGEYTFRLEKGAGAGGRILNSEGKPIAGAKVRVSIDSSPRPTFGDGRMCFDSGWDTATTDAEGKWHIDCVPDHPGLKLRLHVSHPDYVPFENARLQEANGITTPALRQQTATLKLQPGIIVHGRVVDPAGRPIKDAIVVHGDRPYFSTLPSKFPTDADGKYRLPALPPGLTRLTIMAPGWAPQMRTVNLLPGLQAQDFHMQPGKPASLQFVDGSGTPVPDVYVSIHAWNGSEAIQSSHNSNHPKLPPTKIPRKANSDGKWEWSFAPDGPVQVLIYSAGYARIELEIVAGEATRKVVLRSEHHITGRVVDAVTGKPLPAFTTVPILVFRKDWHFAERSHAQAGKNGRLDYLPDRTDHPLRVRIEAPGYRTQDGPGFRAADQTSLTQDFQLQPSPPITGLVIDADGRPVTNAEVLLATPTEQVDTRETMSNHKTSTDAAGHFEFPDPGEPFIVIARDKAGSAQAEFTADQHDAGTLRLQPWASVRGQFRDGGIPVVGATIFLQGIRIDSLDRPRIADVEQATTDASGFFEFARVPPIPVHVRAQVGPWRDDGYRSGPSVPLDLQPGEQRELDLGGAGAAVMGKVKLTGHVPADLDCVYSLNNLIRLEPGIRPPAEIANLGFDIRKGGREAWDESYEGRAYQATLPYWYVKLTPEGSFRISGVPAGAYELVIKVYAKPNGCLVDPLAQKTVRVTVTAEDVKKGELTLPEIAVQVAPVPVVGDSPALNFSGVDGKAGTLAECRGKYTVVHFWASWCGPCKQQLPALRRVHEQFAARGLATLGLSVDEDAPTWQAALGRLHLPWRQARLGVGSNAGISSVPAYWLLDPTGKIVARVYDPDELTPLLAERLK